MLHLPGHTPGLVCLWDPEHRLLFADDHLLARTSPNPFLELVDERTTRRALVQYLHSITRVRALDVDWVLPGHGVPFQGHRAAIDSLLRFHTRRQEKLLDSLSTGPRTPVELSEALFGPQEGARLYLTLSEVVGNLEVLEDAARVRRLEDARWSAGRAWPEIQAWPWQARVISSAPAYRGRFPFSVPGGSRFAPDACVMSPRSRT